MDRRRRVNRSIDSISRDADRRILNVGGGTSRQIPVRYHGWIQDLLDIDPAVNPDIVCDAKRLGTLKPMQYDAIFCSHNLEHFHAHEVPHVLAGFRHLLKPHGVAHIVVPDMMALFEAVIAGTHDIEDTWYQSSSGPIAFLDVCYGWRKQIEQGNDYYCHKTGFSETSLTKAIRQAGFTTIYIARDGYNLEAIAFLASPTRTQKREAGLTCR